MDRKYFNGQLAYWKKHLSSPLPRLEFKKSKTQKRPLSFKTFVQSIEFDKSLFADIRTFALKENCTPFMIVVTALSILFYLQTSQQDIRIGTQVANRNSRESESVIGHFVNTLVLRIRVMPELNFRQLLKRVREVVLRAHANQGLPFEALARVLEKERHIERDSLVQVLINYQHEDNALTLPLLNFVPLKLPPNKQHTALTLTAFDVIVNLRETSTELTGNVNFNTNAFGKSHIPDLVQCFVGIVRTIVFKPESLLSKTFKLGVLPSKITVNVNRCS